ncbi:DUF493 family protein [Legionella sp. MW5194]|uniref:HP0495 family protein n=1 Tax=Legionella sp. MW5194 TaxID=2662448 RepID=UPI00193E9023|nr:DUF493 domain-containing protein [Legionella sp. MW5194]QRN03753.1 DUF493 family protein [Legionella sp. MW5194]
MTDKKTFMQFPCQFPIKIIGLNSLNFSEEITTIVTRHFPDTQEQAIVCKDSKEGNYLSITATVYVLDQASLDALYQELSSHPSIKMVL